MDELSPFVCSSFLAPLSASKINYDVSINMLLILNKRESLDLTQTSELILLN